MNTERFAAFRSSQEENEEECGKFYLTFFSYLDQE